MQSCGPPGIEFENFNPTAKSCSVHATKSKVLELIRSLSEYLSAN